MFSFSTKRMLDDADLLYIKSLNDKMSVSKKGQIKLSISITTKTMVDQIEPNAASYYDRLALAKKIVELGIPSSVMLKPVLPFVPIDEFREIVDDFCAIGINSFITGDLYVEPDSVFFRKYIENSPWTIKRKKVSWLKSKPTWTSVDSSVDLITEIKQYIREIGAHHYDSDQEFINLNLF